METIDDLIRNYYELNPVNEDVDLKEDEARELFRRLMILSQPQIQLLANYSQNKGQGHKIRKFIDDEITRIVKRLGMDAQTFMDDLINDLRYQYAQDPILHEEIINQAMSELEAEEKNARS